MSFCQTSRGVYLSALRNPPVATFFLCLMTLSITLLCIGAYIETHPVKDFSQDWDGFLKTLSLQKICPQGNTTGQPPSPDLARDSALLPDHPSNVSVLASIVLSPQKLAVNLSGLQISTTGRQLGMTGPSVDARLLVTVTSGGWSVQCNDSGAECPVKHCVTVLGPQILLPQSRSSPKCPVSSGGVQLQPHLYGVGAAHDISCCSIVYNGDSDLRNMLSQGERSLCFHRLLISAVCLSVLWVILYTISCCMNRPLKVDKWTPVGL
ncbi:insulin-like growth factor-binding protein 3 receptor [Pseudophryne corroboree]|uniref:insulin-like growth factor-binding protein 3 receptor n=1 Tax=Pseudophryne corroboree TaxID=495146 RepID=UPI003081424D